MTACRRAPLPLFNEKLICGLGRGVAVTGRLTDEAVKRALRELRRFKVMCKQVRCEPCIRGGDRSGPQR